MGTKVTFNGPEDFRVLGSADLKKEGVEGFRQTTFAQGIPTEVEDEVAKVLIEKDIYGNFAFADDEVIEDDEDQDKDTKPAKKVTKVEAVPDKTISSTENASTSS